MPTPTDDTLIPIGHIRKSHGIRGELSLAFMAEDPALLKGEVFLLPSGTPDATPKKYVVEKFRAHHGGLLISFKGVTTRNDADLLRQCSVLVPKSRLAPLDDDEVYLLDLPGLRVLALDEKDGTEREIGVITSVDIPSGQELWTITTPDGKEILFPAVDEFVLDIDLDAGAARIAPPPGLLELYLDAD